MKPTKKKARTLVLDLQKPASMGDPERLAEFTRAIEEPAKKIATALRPLRDFSEQLAGLDSDLQHLGRTHAPPHVDGEAIKSYLREVHQKAEQRWCEEEQLEELRLLRRAHKQERDERQRLAAQVRAHEEELARYRTGAPGRPGSRHFVLREFQRRAASGDLEETLAEQARVLAGWLEENHPEAHPITAGTVENILRGDYHEAQRRLKRR